MSNYTVNRIGSFEYQISGDNIEVSVTSYNAFSHRPIDKVTGKGSRKIKAEILPLLQNFIRDENEEKRKNLKTQAVAYCSNPPEILPGFIYSVTVPYAIEYQYGYEDDSKTSTSLMDYETTMRHVKLNRALHVSVENIQNTAIYCIGRFIGSGQGHKVRQEKRLFVMFNGIKLTGLALKEMAQEGVRFYTLYEDKRRLESIEEEFRRFELGFIRALFGLVREEREIIDVDMRVRFGNEVARAKAAPE
ncbi:hypothetical protein POF51_29570 [Brevibacillus sp. AG]|uniref:hypothetical protein n=1 Tax=Brevibacillus sp. AG TaxID=3020891 RepID=UPI00232BC465|nr:hypothetical protein [Brevibacillus sp. AG]MDC0764874.1 hypothetical protein [Brevibacillus sp. AG]